MLGFYISYIMLGMQTLLKSVFIKYQSNGEVKNNVQNFANKAESTAGQVVNKVDQVQNKARNIVDQGKMRVSDIIQSMKRPKLAVM